MKNLKLLLFIIFPFISLAQTSKITYLDFDGKELSYNQFYKIQSKGILVGQNDEGSVYRLIKEREKQTLTHVYHTCRALSVVVALSPVRPSVE